MNESVIKIISGDYYNLTFENDQYYTLNLSPNEYTFVASVNENINYKQSGNRLIDFGKIELYARYVGKSRVDNNPIFAIDMTSEIRKQVIKNMIE